jgi:membrane AbrB-like protein
MLKTVLIWGALLALSVFAVASFEAARLPAALLLGCMVAPIAVGAVVGGIAVPRVAFVLAQGIVGCLIARSIPLAILGTILADWPLFLGAVIAVIGACSALGWMLARYRVLPGTVAIWGLSPGAASVVTIMAGEFGSDMRLVAFMQYLRVVCVSALAPVVTRLWTHAPPGVQSGVQWFPLLEWPALLGTVVVAFGGAWLGPILRIPAGSLLLPLAAAVLLQDSGHLAIDLPPWLLALSYAALGWSVSLRFNRAILLHALSRLPQITAAIFALIAICGLCAAALVVLAGVDPLTAYLATSPGGADSIAIIAASSPVDVPFVMALQTARLMLVLVIGPSIARFVANRVRPAASSRHCGVD